jgi:hypothetical protein
VVRIGEGLSPEAKAFLLQHLGDLLIFGEVFGLQPGILLRVFRTKPELTNGREVFAAAVSINADVSVIRHTT